MLTCICDKINMFFIGEFMHYGNQYSKRFMGVVIVILFIGGFIKGIYKSTQSKETITTLNLKVVLNDDWSLVKYDKDSDSIILQDDQGTANIQMEEIEIDDETITQETIGDWKVTGYQTNEKPYHLYLKLEGNQTVYLDYESSKKSSLNHLKTLIKNITLGD